MPVWIIGLGLMMSAGLMVWQRDSERNWAVATIPLIVSVVVAFVLFPAVDSMIRALEPESPGQIAAELPDCPEAGLQRLEYRTEQDDHTLDVVEAFRLNGWQNI